MTEAEARAASAPEKAPAHPGDDLLLAFVRERDIACPACGYNIRNLTRSECPECREQLRLRVDYDRPGFGLLIGTLAPSIFCFIVSVLLFGVMMIAPGTPPPAVFLLAGFLVTSAAVGFWLFAIRERFIRIAVPLQWLIFGTTWAVHVGAFVVCVTWMP